MNSREVLLVRVSNLDLETCKRLLKILNEETVSEASKCGHSSLYYDFATGGEKYRKYKALIGC